MATRRKHDWKKIQEYYNQLVKMNEPKPNPIVCKKFEVPSSTLSDKISKENWNLTEAQDKAIKGFAKSVSEVSMELTEASTEAQKQIMHKKIEDSLKVSKIGSNAISLIQRAMYKANKQLQEAIEEGEEVTASDLSAYTRMGKEGYTLANPQPKTQVNIQNNQTVSTKTDKEKREEYKSRRVEILGK